MPPKPDLSNIETEPHVLTVRKLKREGIEPTDLSIGAGECVVLTGPSGSGKSLLLRAIADLDPSEGDVRLNETPRETIPAPNWRRNVVYVATESGWWSKVVGDHFPDPSAATPFLNDMALPPDALTWSVDRLSTGERQRLALLRALVLASPVLLLDEPTSALDREATLKVEALLLRQLTTGTAILLVSHDSHQAERLSARRLAIENGRLVTEDKLNTGLGGVS
jgi:ABC-type iron transport system FetAB ATPase subunit